MELIEKYLCHHGWQQIWQHDSQTLHCKMRFAVYLPALSSHKRLPVFYWLSGLSCSEQNFITKAAAQYHANKYHVIIVAPDTSPRGADVADDAAYDLGQGAGFYINATQSPWRAHYQMYDYLLTELPALIRTHFPTSEKQSICGHSMGGHGALILALKNPDHYACVSAFSPIVAPTQVPWGQKIFANYLGADEQTWRQYDAVELIRSGHSVPEIYVEQSLDDPFYATQLRTYLLKEICDEKSVRHDIRLHYRYDHSYYFIASFIGEHIRWHAQRLHSSE